MNEDYRRNITGETLLNDKKYNEALNLLNRVIECSQFELLLNTVKSEAYFNKGFALWKLNINSEAINCFDKAIETNSMNSFAYLFKSFSLANLANYSEAQESFDKATKYNAKVFSLLAYSNGPIQYFFLILSRFIIVLLVPSLYVLLFHVAFFFSGSNIFIRLFFIVFFTLFILLFRNRIFNFFNWVIWVPLIKSIQYNTIRESSENESDLIIFFFFCFLLMSLIICNAFSMSM
jgi:tetratricopeptide (TPR) repeat protein